LDAISPSGRSEVVEIATSADASDWDAALAGLSNSSFYHRYAWRQVNEDGLGHPSTYLIARRGTQVAGILPLTLVSSRLFGRILCSLPFVNFGGPCADSASVSRLLVERAKAHARAEAADCLELRCTNENDIGVEPTLRKVSMVIPLEADPDRLWSRFTPKHRKNVRRAQKNDLAVVSGRHELLPDFYSVMERAWRDLGTPFYGREYFERILAAFPEETRIFLCSHRHKPVAAALVGYFDRTVEGLWNGSVAEARTLSANYVLYWEMIRDACERGFVRFHLGRSTSASGAEEFKSRWCAEKRQLYWYAWSPCGRPILQVNVENPRYRLGIQTWKRLPLPVTRIVGPCLARWIP
jgi:FemAB-related protein (PEP-CTERM system-associated)